MQIKQAPVNPNSGSVTPPDITDVQLIGGFWGTLQDLNREAIIPHALKWVNKLGWVENFDNAASGAPYRHKGREFADSEVYKLIEAMAWDSTRPGGEKHLPVIADLTKRILGAQEPDGYLHTRYGRRFQEPRYFDMTFGHELYCAGHQLQSAVAVARTNANSDYVEIARRLADHVVRMFGVSGHNEICGHACIEMGLVEFYRLTGERKYLEQAAIFVERHGEGSLPLFEFGRAYWQDRVKVRDLDVLEGHAVRALYLASAAVDVAVETQDQDLLNALVLQWDNTIAKRTYITGGMGSHHMDEAFGSDYVLPNDRSYCESCAGVASIMFSWRLLLATGEKKYADLIERTLYNVVATAPSREGTSFFYANTLHQRVAHTEPAFNDEGVVIRGGASGRQEWFEVSCCPPNVSRLLASLGGYVFGTQENSLNIYQYMAGRIETKADQKSVVLQVTTNFPVDGKVSIEALETPPDGITLKLRVPHWLTNQVPIEHLGPESETSGNAVFVPGEDFVELKVSTGDQISFEFELVAKYVRADDRVDASRGCVAVMRGPLVYALESTDLPDAWDLSDVYVSTGAGLITDGMDVKVHLQHVERKKEASVFDAQECHGSSEMQVVSLVPYFDWAERGASTMRVWIPEVLHEVN